MAWGLKVHVTAATPLTKFGCPEAGIGRLAYQGEEASMLIPARASRAIAVSQLACGPPWVADGRFEPIAR